VAIAPDKPRGAFKIPAIPITEDIKAIGTLPAAGPIYMRCTQFPFHTALAVGEPYSIFILYPGAKEAIEAIPGLPTPYMPSLRVHYRIDDAPGAGKGMFALTDLDTGDLILRERPLLLFPLCMPNDPAALEMTLVQTVASMKPEDSVAFVWLANCKTEMNPIWGIINTNALNALRLPGPYDGVYGGVSCQSQVSHSCMWTFSKSLTIITAALRTRLMDGFSKTLCMNFVPYALSRKGNRFPSHMSPCSSHARIGKRSYDPNTLSLVAAHHAPFLPQKYLIATFAETYWIYEGR